MSPDDTEQSRGTDQTNEAIRGISRRGVLGAGLVASVAGLSTLGFDASPVGASPVGAVKTFVVDSYTGTDDQKMAAAFADWAASSIGGTIVLPPRAMTLLDQYVTAEVPTSYTLPNGATATTIGKYLGIIGSGSAYNGRFEWIDGTSVVDAQYSGTGTAKFVFKHIGTVELSNFLLKDSAGDAVPFVLVTNATLMAHDMGVQGSKWGATCDQDAFWHGGNTQSQGGLDTSGFQGYGATIERVYFDQVRRCAYYRTWANATHFNNNLVSHSCGSNLSDGACVEYDGQGQGNGCQPTGGGTLRNLFEATHYPYVIKSVDGLCLSFIGDDFYDETSTLAFFKFEATSESNLVMVGFYGESVPLLSDDNGKNTVISGHIGAGSVMAAPVTFKLPPTMGGINLNGGPGTNQIQPAATMSPSGILLRARAAAADGSHPVFQLQYNGTLTIGGSSAGNVTFQDTSGNPVMVWSSGARIWTTNGNMAFNIGTSYFDMNCYTARVLSALDNSVQHQFGYTGIGFFGHGLTGQQTIGGTVTGGTLAELQTAVKALLKALASYGLVVDSTK